MILILNLAIISYHIWKTYFSASTPEGHLRRSPEISLKTEHGYTFSIEQRSMQVPCVQSNKVLSVPTRQRKHKAHETDINPMN